MYILLFASKSLLKDNFGFLQSSPKMVISEIDCALWGVYMASTRRAVCAGRIQDAFLCATTARRWTAASVGALRYCTAIVPHTTDIDPIASESSGAGRIFVHAGLQPRDLQPSGYHVLLLSNACTLRCVCYTGLYIIFPFTVLGLCIRIPYFTRSPGSWSRNFIQRTL